MDDTNRLNPIAWKSASVIVPIIVGAAGMAVFVLWGKLKFQTV